MDEEFRRRSLNNVTVTSFGVTVDPVKHLHPPSGKAIEYGMKHRLDLRGRIRRSLADEDVGKEIMNADLLIGMSPTHCQMVAEYFAEKEEGLAGRLLRKSYTLKGLANRTQWREPFLASITRVSQRPYRSLATLDPYYDLGTPKGVRMLDEVVADARKAVGRILGEKSRR